MSFENLFLAVQVMCSGDSIQWGKNQYASKLSSGCELGKAKCCKYLCIGSLSDGN